MLEIIFVSDYVCPYCLVGKEVLRQALEEMDIEADIIFQPVELTVEPSPRVDTFHDRDRRERYKRILTKECLQALGLEDMKIPPKVIPRPYTRLAYEGWIFAQSYGKDEEYNDLVYKAYFMEEKDIGDIEVLTSIAGKAGLQENLFHQALEEGTYTEREKEIIQRGTDNLKIDALPTFVINGEERILNEFSKEEMIKLLQNETKREQKRIVGCSLKGCG